MAEYEFIDPRSIPFVEPRSRGELPHLFKEGCTYFLTYRLWDAVIPSTQKQLSAKLSTTEIAAFAEPPIQLGSCVLMRPEIAGIVQENLLHFKGSKYHLLAWCIMPNHVHAVIAPTNEFTLSAITHSWKSYTAHRIQSILNRVDPIWERESFDHLIRDADDLAIFIHYVEENPVVAGLCANSHDWQWSSAFVKKNTT
ncbi:MAG TPA: transposase [Planctomycetota bacterium]|nr:transposase [Planctomycetota bacterium]